MPLKDTNCRNAKPQDKPYRLYDEQGLYLEVQPNGGRYWRLKYRFLGKEKRLALGVYPEVGLQEARRKRDDARVQLAGGQDPSLQRRMAKVVSQLDHQHTFESVAKQWLTIRESTWDPEYTRTVRQRLELNAYPGWENSQSAASAHPCWSKTCSALSSAVLARRPVVLPRSTNRFLSSPELPASPRQPDRESLTDAPSQAGETLCCRDRS